ncbi:phospholipid scramblase 2 isoform X2 [Orussus abietinus]|uniref:phospholipid scramblase 2 isoform X2 n=1 Tax=Orussus abietinus TaxID=222816 RepID=UPI00062561FA|nr:phospholipid scramblase 2 isoform X2 [Orussus abietinus]
MPRAFPTMGSDEPPTSSTRSVSESGNEIPNLTHSEEHVHPPIYSNSRVITIQPQHRLGNQPPRTPFPVNTVDWVSTPRSQLSVIFGSSFLAGTEQLEIQPVVDLSTLLGQSDSGNQYKIKVPRAETLFLVTETSTKCQRDVLGSSRGFTLKAVDPTGQVAFTFRKPITWGCVPGLLHKLTVESSEPIGSVEQNFSLFGLSFTVYDEKRAPFYKISGPSVGCCCIYEESQFQILSLDGTHQVASLIHHWDHLLVEYVLLLTVPADMNVKLKGILILWALQEI